MSDLFVMDGSTAGESGVTNAPSPVIPTKFDVENSSTYLRCAASR